MTADRRIGIVQSGGLEWEGGVEYTKNLAMAAAFASASHNGRRDVVYLASEGLSPSTVNQLEEAASLVKVPGDSPSLLSRVYRKLTRVNGITREASRQGLEFLYPLGFQPQARSIRWAAWIPDLQHRYYPEFFNATELAGRDQWMGHLSRIAPMIVFSSEAAKADFRKFFPDGKARLESLPFRVHIPEGFIQSDPLETVRKYHLPAKFLLVCNQLWKHKNHSTLLKAIAEARTNCPDLLVVLTGAMTDYRNSGHPNEIVAQIHTNGVSSNVRLLGFIPKRDQINLLRACSGVVQPSLFEGWSTIVEEAHCVGKPIALSDIDVHREQSPPDSHYFDPNSPAKIGSCVEALWSSTTGYEPDRELEALAAYKKLFLAFGERFLTIVDG